MTALLRCQTALAEAINAIDEASQGVDDRRKEAALGALQVLIEQAANRLSEMLAEPSEED